MSQPRAPREEATRFIEFLRQRYAEDRGALANLRAALSDTRRHRAWPLLGAWLGSVRECELRTFEIVAALWADDPDSRAAASVDIGAALRRLATEHNSFDGRFRRLLTCDRAEIAERVAPVVRAAQAKGVPVNHARLLSDLLCWGDEVKLRWATSFWGVPDDEATLGADLVDGAPEKSASATEKHVTTEVTP